MPTSELIELENRRHVRFPINAVLIIINTTNGRLYSGLCCNISAEGLLISSEDDLPENTLLRLEISEDGCVFIADGHVVRKAKGNNIFLIGLRVDFHILKEDI